MAPSRQPTSGSPRPADRARTGSVRRPPPPPSEDPDLNDAVDAAMGDQIASENAPVASGGRRTLRIAVLTGSAVLALGLGLAFGLAPLRISMAVSTLDNCRDDAGREEEARIAADRWLGLVGNDRKKVLELVRGDHGPVPVQIHIAESAGSIPALITILERPSINPAYRQFALKALDRLTDPPPEDPILAEDIASNVAVWVRDPQLLPEASDAAMSIYVRLRPDAAELVLFDALRQAGSDQALVTKALDGLAKRMRKARFQTYLDLATGVAGPTVRQHKAFYRDGVVKLASTESTPILLSMLANDDAAQRVVAFDCLAGPNYALPKEDTEKLRERIGLAAASSMARDRHPRETSAAFATARRLHLHSCVNAILQLSRDLGDLTPYDVTFKTVAEALGRDLTTGIPVKDAEAVIARLSSALGEAPLRPTAIAALAQIRNQDVSNLATPIKSLETIKTPEAQAALKNLSALRDARAKKTSK